MEVPGSDGRRQRKSRTFSSLAGAKAWRADALGEVRAGKLRATSPMTVRTAAREYVEGARSGTIRNRSGDVYKPSAVAGIDHAFAVRVLPALGARRLADVERAEIQRLVNKWSAEVSPSTVRNTVNALRALYRYAISVDAVTNNPTRDLMMPAVRGRRDRIAPPSEAKSLLEVLGERDRAFWATAVYAGLRRGELLALCWCDIDLGAGLIHVRRSYDPEAHQFVAPKSEAGTRDVPVPKVLRTLLVAHKLGASDTSVDALVFPGRGGRPLAPNTITNRARAAWKAENERRRDAAAGAEWEALSPIGLHECRHTYASFMIAADVNMKQLSTWMGHATINITQDRYGHLLPGAEADGAAKLDRFLSASSQ